MVRNKCSCRFEIDGQYKLLAHFLFKHLDVLFHIVRNKHIILQYTLIAISSEDSVRIAYKNVFAVTGINGIKHVNPEKCYVDCERYIVYATVSSLP